MLTLNCFWKLGEIFGGISLKILPSFLLRPLTDSEALPVQRHRNADNLKSPQETQAPVVEKKSKKPKKKEKKHKEKEREKEKRKERERKANEDDKKVISLLLSVIFFYNSRRAS